MPLFRGGIGGFGMCQARRLCICAMENFLSARQVYDGPAEIEEPVRGEYDIISENMGFVMTDASTFMTRRSFSFGMLAAASSSPCRISAANAVPVKARRYTDTNWRDPYSKRWMQASGAAAGISEGNAT